jgi:hypothetical protein
MGWKNEKHLSKVWEHVGRCWFWWDYLYDVPKELKSELAFPYGNQESKDTVFSSVDYAKLNSAVANALIWRKKDKRTRSVIVIHKDRIIVRNTILVLIKSKIWVGRWPKALRPPFWNIKTGKIWYTKPAPIVEWQQDKRKILQQMICFTWILDWMGRELQYDLWRYNDVISVWEYGKNTIREDSCFCTNTIGTILGRLTYCPILRGQFKTHQEYLDFGMRSWLIKSGCTYGNRSGYGG